MSFFTKGMDRSSFKKPRLKPITYQERVRIEAELRSAQIFGLVRKTELQAIADSHDVSPSTIDKIARLHGMRTDR